MPPSCTVQVLEDKSCFLHGRLASASCREAMPRPRKRQAGAAGPGELLRRCRMQFCSTQRTLFVGRTLLTFSTPWFGDLEGLLLFRRLYSFRQNFHFQSLPLVCPFKKQLLSTACTYGTVVAHACGRLRQEDCLGFKTNLVLLESYISKTLSLK